MDYEKPIMILIAEIEDVIRTSLNVGEENGNDWITQLYGFGR